MIRCDCFGFFCGNFLKPHYDKICHQVIRLLLLMIVKEMCISGSGKTEAEVEKLSSVKYCSPPHFQQQVGW